MYFPFAVEIILYMFISTFQTFNIYSINKESMLQVLQLFFCPYLDALRQ